MTPKPITGARRALGIDDSLNLSRQSDVSDVIGRFSGWALVISVATYFTAVDVVGIQTSEWNIVWWVLLYTVYLIVIEGVSHLRAGWYETFYARMIRIQFQLVMITFLIRLGGSAQIFLWFVYLIPILASALYFDQIKLQLLVLFESAFGLGVAMFTRVPQNQFGVAEFAGTVVALSIALLILRLLIQGRRSDSDRLVDIVAQFHTTLELSDLLDVLVASVLKLTHGEQVIVVVIDPVSKRLVDHRLHGYKLVSDHTADELAHECSVIRTGEPFEYTDLAASFVRNTFYQRFFDRSPHSLIARPLFSKDRQILGVLGVSSDHRNWFAPRERQLINFITFQAGSAIENCLNHTKERKRTERRRKLTDLSHELMSAGSEATIGAVLVRAAHELIPHAQVSVLHRYNGRADELVPIGAVPMEPHELGRTRMRKGIGIAGTTLVTLRVENVPDVTQDSRFVPSAREGTFRSLMVAPLFLSRNRTFGTLSVHCNAVGVFDDEDSELLAELAYYGVAATLYKQIVRQSDLLTRVLEKAQSFDVKMSEQDFGKQIVKVASEVFEFQAARLRLLDASTQELRTVAVVGVQPEVAARLLGDRVLQTSLAPLFQDKYREGKCYLIDHDYEVWEQIPKGAFHCSTEPAERKEGWGTQDSLLAPLVAPGGKLVGLLTLDSPRSGLHPAPEIMEAIAVFANLAAWAISTQSNYDLVVQGENNVRRFVGSLSEIARSD
ncbi:MAG: GAF domain-containing protein, partial [Chloroflexi bacterium]|nr:GAF domain-containing protein [Chloroflexota bacterium]